MKRIILTVMGIALIATASIAKSPTKKVVLLTNSKSVLVQQSTCTVTVKTDSPRSVSYTVTCDCTMKSACDAAYSLGRPQ